MWHKSPCSFNEELLNCFLCFTKILNEVQYIQHELYFLALKSNITCLPTKCLRVHLHWAKEIFFFYLALSYVSYVSDIAFALISIQYKRTLVPVLSLWPTVKEKISPQKNKTTFVLMQKVNKAILGLKFTSLLNTKMARVSIDIMLLITNMSSISYNLSPRNYRCFVVTNLFVS